MLFFVHHCELPSLDHINRANPAPMNLHLQHPQPPAEEDLEVDAPQAIADSPIHHGENQVPIVHPRTSGSGDQLDAADEGQSSSRNQDQTEESLMRFHLHRTSVTSSGDVGVTFEPTQETDYQSGEQLSDEELRRVRLQHFDKKNE